VKKIGRFLVLLVVLTLLVLAFAVPHTAVFAGDGASVQAAETLPPFDLTTVLVTFASLSGTAVFIAAVVNLLKMFGAVKDDTAASWSAGLNLAALITVIVLQILGKIDVVPALDSQAGVIANVLTAIGGLVWQIFLSRTTHVQVLAGLPGVGTSNSNRVAGESHYEILSETTTTPTVE
jgi:hypothetical protein